MHKPAIKLNSSLENTLPNGFKGVLTIIILVFSLNKLRNSSSSSFQSADVPFGFPSLVYKNYDSIGYFEKECKFQFSQFAYRSKRQTAQIRNMLKHTKAIKINVRF